MTFFFKGFRYLDYVQLAGSANRLLHFLTCSLLKQYINAGNFLKIFWDPICYHVYSNESGRNYSSSYNIDRKWRLPELSSFYKVSTANLSREPSDWTLAAQLRTCTWTWPGSSELLQPDSPPSPSSLSAVPTGSPQPAHLPLGMCPPTCLQPGREVSLFQARANPPLSFRNYLPLLQRTQL